MAGSRKPFYEEFSEQIIMALEKGTAPWIKPWKPGEYSAPFNPVSGTRYQGVNRVHLSMEGHEDPRFMSLKQANAEGWRVRKGEKSRRVVFWQFSQELPEKDENGNPVLDAEGKQTTEKHLLDRPILRFASVFHASQIEGIPAWSPDPSVAWQGHEQCERILQSSGARIYHDQRDRAFYRLRDDAIHLPPKANFPVADGYYATALHELGHWTGAPERMGREFGPFGSEVYAREELRAEIASWMVGLDLGVGHDPGQHAAYVASWIQALKKDPYEIVRVCRDAEKIRDMVVGFGLVLEQHKMKEPVRMAPTIEGSARLAPEKTYLHVPFAEKELAKAVGARWDRKEKLWFAPCGANLEPFDRWIKPVESERRCPALSPEVEFAEVARVAGLYLPGGKPIMDGEIHRVPVDGKPNGKDGAYCVHADGRPAGWVHNHRTGERVEWVATGCQLSQAQLNMMRASAAEKREEVLAQRQQQYEQAAKRAFGIWKNAPTWAPADHPYLAAKHVHGYGVKRGENGVLLIPGRDVDGRIHTLQLITPEGEKRFLSGGQKHGMHHVIDPGHKLGHHPILVAEGYATAASVHEALKLPVVVAFDSGNLAPVAQALHSKYPRQPILVLADDDHRQANNPGLRHGRMAAEAVGGLCLSPDFNQGEKESGLTDWNDLAASRGLEAVCNALTPVVTRLARQQTVGMEQ